MALRKKLTQATLPAIALFLACYQSSAHAAPATLQAVKADTAPVLDGIADDAVWSNAPAAELEFGKGANFGDNGRTSGTLRAVRVDDTL